jgi:hypothetical protein
LTVRHDFFPSGKRAERKAAYNFVLAFFHGKIAKARAGKPRPLRTFG